MTLAPDLLQWWEQVSKKGECPGFGCSALAVVRWPMSGVECVPTKGHTVILTPGPHNVTLLGEGVFTELIKLK